VGKKQPRLPAALRSASTCTLSFVDFSSETFPAADDQER
jgi:hypothetical protein